MRLLKDLATPLPSEVINDNQRLADWKALKHLMAATWFSRRWVIQELALARNAVVLCGGEFVHCDALRDGINLFVANADSLRERFRESKEVNNDYHALGDPKALAATILIETVGEVFFKDSVTNTSSPKQGFEPLVSSLSAFDTSDPRDTINALLNISKECICLNDRLREEVNGGTQSTRSHIAPVFHRGMKLPPPPSYSKDLLDVYVDFLSWVVESTGNINMLCRHWALPERAHPVSGCPDLVKLPSWIKLAWNGPFKRTGNTWCRQNADSLVGLHRQSPYNACDRFNKRKIEFNILEKGESTTSWNDTLAVRRSACAIVDGFELGSIGHCMEPMSGGNIPAHTLQWLGWRKQQIDQPYSELKDDIWRPLVAERGSDGKNPPPLWQKVCGEILANYTDSGSINILLILPMIREEQTKKFLERVHQVTWNCRSVVPVLIPYTAGHDNTYLTVKINCLYVDV